MNQTAPDLAEPRGACTLTGGKLWASLLSLALIGAVLSPIRQNWRPKPHDSFPLSYFPMFSARRKAVESFYYLVARDENGSAKWSLDALAQVATEAGIRVKRSQIRRILLKERVRWRQTHSWGTPRDKDFVPKERRSSVTTRSRPRARRPSAPMS